MKITVHETRIDIHREQGETGNAQTIRNTDNGHDEEEWDDLLPGGSKKQMARQEADDKESQGGMDSAALLGYFDAYGREDELVPIAQNRHAGQAEDPGAHLG